MVINPNLCAKYSLKTQNRQMKCQTKIFIKTKNIEMEVSTYQNFIKYIIKF